MKKFRCDRCHVTTEQTMPMIIPNCPNCGLKVFMFELEEKTDREKAIEWWNNDLFYNQQQEFNYKINEDQIEQIWRKETQQKSLIELQADKVEEIAFKNLKKEEVSQVNFELLKNTIKKLEDPIREDMVNLQLFFELLSKSSSFAHKAHKELNKLMK